MYDTHGTGASDRAPGREARTTLLAANNWFTGKDIGDHIYAALFGDKEEAKTDTIVAQTRDDSVMPAVTQASAEPALASPETSVAVPPVDDLDKDAAARASQTQLPPLSSLAPRLIPDVFEQAALSGYLRGRKRDHPDESSPRLYLKV